jgi:hypothetical protein
MIIVKTFRIYFFLSMCLNIINVDDILWSSISYIIRSATIFTKQNKTENTLNPMSKAAVPKPFLIPSACSSLQEPAHLEPAEFYKLDKQRKQSTSCK